MRRLSIIDLVGGHQPIYNETRDLVSICNGELYNFQGLARQLEDLGHVFATASDVEVAVHGYEAWGDDFVTRINGMFALAMWDVRRRRLLLARDRMGKKPLYYAQLPGGLAFASELRSLLAFPAAAWTVDRDACRTFCLLGYLPGDRTPIAQIRRLPPGHLAVWARNDFTMRRYWEPEPAAPPPTEPEAADTLLELLCDAVRLRLISDVPLGAFLSGGLDSSVVVAVAAGRLGARIPTFNISFPGYADYDEAHHARRVADHFGCKHHEIPVDSSHFEDLGAVVWALDEPLADPAALPTLLLSREARKEVTVALTGEGADEVFGGYERYSLALRGSALAGRLGILRSLAAAGLRVRRRRSADDSRVSRLLRSATEGDASPLAWSRSVASAPAVVEAAGWERREVMVLRDSGEMTHSRGNGRLVALQLDDLGSALANGLLVKVDRMSMAASLEARCPFLDYRVVNFGLGLPDAWKIRRRTGKVLLRRAVQQLLPRGIHDRAKHTFRVPLAQWLRGPLRDLVREAASSPVLAKLGIVRGRAIRDLAEDHVVGRADFSRALWAVVTLHLWLAEATRHVRLDASE